MLWQGNSQPQGVNLEEHPQGEISRRAAHWLAGELKGLLGYSLFIS